MIIETGNKPIVKCDGCGKEISSSGSMVDHEDNPDKFYHFCDECTIGSAGVEFRICDRCGMPMIAGMTNLENFYACLDCFEQEMNERCPDGWRTVEDDGCEGFYEMLDDDGKWYGTGIFYTCWY